MKLPGLYRIAPWYRWPRVWLTYWRLRRVAKRANDLSPHGMGLTLLKPVKRK